MGAAPQSGATGAPPKTIVQPVTYRAGGKDQPLIMNPLPQGATLLPATSSGGGEKGGGEARQYYSVPNPAYATYAANQAKQQEYANYTPPVLNSTRAKVLSQHQLQSASNNRSFIGSSQGIGGTGSTTGKKTLLGQ